MKSGEATAQDDERWQPGVMPFNNIGYDYALSTSNILLYGVGDLDYETAVLPDFSITESTKATVDAYTEIDTPQKFYDRAKSYLYDNFAGETSTLVSRDGNTINAKHNIVIDKDAGSAFAISGNEIRIKATTFIGIYY